MSQLQMLLQLSDSSLQNRKPVDIISIKITWKDNHTVYDNYLHGWHTMTEINKNKSIPVLYILSAENIEFNDDLLCKFS